MTNVTEAERARLYRGVAETVGPDEAETLMQLLPTSQLEDVATTADIAQLQATTTADIAQLQAATKADIAQLQATTTAEVAQLRTEMRADTTRLEAAIANIEERMATKVELGELRSEMRVGFVHVDARFAEMDATFELQFRNLLVWLVGTILAVASMLAALQVAIR